MGVPPQPPNANFIFTVVLRLRSMHKVNIYGDERFIFANLECLHLPGVQEKKLSLHVGYLILLLAGLPYIGK